MVLSIHQPHFFPWLGYFDKILRSDIFVYLDNVQFTKNYFQNRTQVKGSDGEIHWLTIPIQKASLETPICQIQIANNFDADLIKKKISGFYSNSKFYEEVIADVFSLIDKQDQSLSKLNISSIEWALKKINIGTKRLVASEMNVFSKGPTERLIELCKGTECNIYLSGIGGKKYMDMVQFENNDIDVIFQDFQPEIYTYTQINNSFKPGLSILDSFFNIGYLETEIMLKKQL
jgi:hypothetical protein